MPTEQPAADGSSERREQFSEPFPLYIDPEKNYQAEIVNGSVEPDQKKEVVHVWPRAKGAARAKMYKARRAMIRGDMAAAARYIGIVSHYIEDGIVHGAMDAIGHTADHSTLEGEIGARADITAATPASVTRWRQSPAPAAHT